MKRYHKLLAGASWMAEYGDPDTDDWEFLQKYSPYQSEFDELFPAFLCFLWPSMMLNIPLVRLQTSTNRPTIPPYWSQQAPETIVSTLLMLESL
jgi:hypothetical protein